MPSESIPAPLPLPSPALLGNSNIKCSHCGGSGLPSSSSRGGEEMIILDEEIERVCAACWRAEQREEENRSISVGLYPDTGGEDREAMEGIGLGLEGMHVGDMRANNVESPRSSIEYAQPVSILPTSTAQVKHVPSLQPHSLPPQPTRAWTTHPAPILPINEECTITPPLIGPIPDRPSNPLLDVTRARVSSSGRGALYPGSVFKGTQTSGRSAYDVEVRFVDVNIPESTVSGHLSISHLTDTHPHLTTFFTGEIIGPKYGFITGPRFSATEHDDMRHWGRFEQFRRPSTRADMIRPDLLLRDPVGKGPDKRGMERDFVFLRIKERFLVPDHTVRDISGASFAGFYFAMIDLNPSPTSDPPLSPTSPTIPKPTLSPIPPISPTTSASQYFPFVPPLSARRQSTGPPSVQPPTMGHRRMSGSGPRSPVLDAGGGGRRRRESMGSGVRAEKEGQREATIRGYYFHSLNQEPFQELFLTHIPNKSCGVYEMR